MLINVQFFSLFSFVTYHLNVIMTSFCLIATNIHAFNAIVVRVLNNVAQ